MTRCDLLESIGEKKQALQGYRRLHGSLKSDQGPEYLEASREIARLLHERGDVEAAKNIIAQGYLPKVKEIQIVYRFSLVLCYLLQEPLKESTKPST